MAGYIYPKYYAPQCYLETITYKRGTVEYLAATWGWHLDVDQPQETRIVRVSPIRLTDMNRFLVGLKINEFQGEVGVIPGGPLYGYRYISFVGWEEITETRPFKPPRRGKDRYGPYRWHWEPRVVHGIWHRYYLEECDGCGSQLIDPYDEDTLVAPCGIKVCSDECLEAHQEWCKQKECLDGS